MPDVTNASVPVLTGMVVVAKTAPFSKISTVEPSSASNDATLKSTVTVGVESVVVTVDPPWMLTPLGAVSSVVVMVKKTPALLLLVTVPEVMLAVRALAPASPRSA